MQIFKLLQNNIIKLIIVILITIIVLFVIFFNSIKLYWQETYHTNIPIKLEKISGIYNFGQVTYNFFNDSSANLYNGFNQKFMIISEFYNKRFIKKKVVENKVKLSLKRDNEIKSIHKKDKKNELLNNNNEVNVNNNADNNIDSNLYNENVILTTDKKVFFVGDSLMQGIAPFVQRSLTKEYRMKSINLSKQSTGLSYPGFFDWNKVIEDTIKENPDIGVIIVFLGPNDPWDIIDPNSRNNKYLKFQSKEWEQVYKKRIRDILQVAKDNDIKVIWMSIPLVKRKKLNIKCQYLNNLYFSEVKDNHGIFIDTNMIFQYTNGEYKDYLIDEHNKKSIIRTKDGTHFTPYGQKLLANYVVKKLIIKKESK